MPNHVEDVKNANSQDTFQTIRELNAFWDHSLNVTALADTLLIDTLVKNAHMVNTKIQETHKDVLMLQDVMLEPKLLVFVIQLHATDAEPVLFHKFQEMIDQSAIDQDHNVDVLKNTLLMVTAASNALMDKYLMMLDYNATQLHNAMALEKSLVLEETATDAHNAKETLFQMTSELLVLDQFQSANAMRNTLLMDMNAKPAQSDKLLIQTTTRDVSHNNAMTEIWSSETETTATNVRCANQDGNQIQQELSASESSQSAAALRSMMLVVTFAFHAHHMRLLPTETKDVSQDNAQDSMTFLELPTNAMHADHARRDLLQTTWEEDA